MPITDNLREPMNGFTHFIGVILSIIGTILLISLTFNPYRPYHFISFTIFGLGMILLFSTSTLYHWLKLSELGTKSLRQADHIMIFIYIAATYTPICILALRGSLGWIFLALVWFIAFGGIVIKIFWMAAPRWLSTVIYILMGWLSVFVIYPLFSVLQIEALIWLFIGGLFYTFGAVIYALKKLSPYPGLLGFHEIFHFLVMLYSFSHFWLMYKYISFLK
jgi:hemolysin III